MWANSAWNWSLILSLSMDITILHMYINTIKIMVIPSPTTLLQSPIARRITSKLQKL